MRASLRTVVLGASLAAVLVPANAADYGVADYGYAQAGIGAHENFQTIVPRARQSGGVRIKDVTTIKGVRDNQLVGYGLVIGLQGSGDSLRNSPFTEQSLQSMLDRMGVNVRGANPRTRNVAAVIVTADLPAFAGIGSRIDVSVSSLGDASSLMGGTLVMTPLYGPDGEIYAVGQGALAVSGFSSEGTNESLTQGTPTTGRIAGGALIEREVPRATVDTPNITMELRNPDYRTAIRVVDAINSFAVRSYGKPVAREQDFRTISLTRPAKMSSTRFIADVGDLMIEPDTAARVVIDERTGTVVIGKDVQISTVAVTHGSLTVRITDIPNVSQPAPFSEGQTVVTADTTVNAEQGGGNLAIVQGANLDSVVRGLNRLGLKPTGIIAILQAIKTAGAMQAEIVVQ
ncbi:flagellar basal body P-ring protein FlgI [Aureimonas phyllosphaerae]|uniref:Flagellar P-ring protein n=1 Tax=Aureimonas phyllosphaerae TaxID=1166078 RepID=A0A7W6BRJ5_9HYPH|nr:flagellar basal body P-ring protein FlgI [Aureimonas phyllosphaerae]MBB3935572.1 flagellar P-ring protein precursor FlgI [Aureimonas phyllosphaerae]MBB3959580.1 flagellar P-ring protein precursor FlgI [Aureimonas phyllosphaerae]SFF12439.1 flagellar P-ring protein precursor FlgI [Aureimonas phyllosphaerae]